MFFAFKLCGSRPIEHSITRKNWTAMIRLVSLIVHVDTNYCYIKERWIMNEKKEEGKRKRIEGTYKIVNNKTRAVVVLWVTYI